MLTVVGARATTPRMAVPYDAFAPHFDAWQRAHGGVYDDLILPRITDALGRHAPAAHRVVDLGIGTGDLAIALAERGHAVIGVDRAPTMLAVAREKAARAGVALELVLQDLATLALDVPADAAVCVYTVVNQLTGDGDLERAFAAVARNVVPGGLFVFETNLPASYERYWNGEEAIDTGSAVIVRTHRRQGDVIEAEVSIRQKTCGGFDEVRDCILQRPYADAEITGALDAAGFRVLERVDYDPFETRGAPVKTLWTGRHG